jgi:hypothetical protein
MEAVVSWASWTVSGINRQFLCDYLWKLAGSSKGGHHCRDMSTREDLTERSAEGLAEEQTSHYRRAAGRGLPALPPKTEALL